MNVWPFMFAASKTSDYQFVVLPEIFDAASCAALRERLEIDDLDPQKTRTATVTAKAGSMSCVYRSGPIVVDNNTHTDTAGRKLLFAFGVVTRELPTGSSFARLSDLIDANRPGFEKGLVSFLSSSDKEWKPRVTKAIKLSTEREDRDVDLRQFSMSRISTLLLFGLLVNLGICAGLYWKVSSLEKQLGALDSILQKVDALSDPGAEKSGTSAAPPKVLPNTLPRAPENELKKSGPLTIEQPRQ